MTPGRRSRAKGDAVGAEPLAVSAAVRAGVLVLAVLHAYVIGIATGWAFTGAFGDEDGSSVGLIIGVIAGCLAATGAVLAVLRYRRAFRRAGWIAAGFLVYHLAVWGSLEVPATVGYSEGLCDGVAWGGALRWSESGPNCDLTGGFAQLLIVGFLTLPIGGLLVGLVVRAAVEAVHRR